MSKHTPGPWYVRYDTQSAMEEHSTPMVFSLDGNVPICEMYSVSTYIANAHLIAAAPDMLAALELLLPYLEDCRMDSEARAAIAKAKGQP